MRPVGRVCLRGPAWTIGPMVRCALLFALISLAAGCGNSRTFEMSVDGSVQYIDALSEEDKTRARQTVARGLVRGLDAYRIGVGDKAEVLFHFGQEPTTERYQIAVGNQLDIKFIRAPAHFGEPPVTDEYLISVGDQITVDFLRPPTHFGKPPVIGDYLISVGDEITIKFLPTARQLRKTPTDEGYRIAVRDQLVIEFLHNPDNNATVRVRPDGRISLPLLEELQVTGMTAEELAAKVRDAYSGILSDPIVTVNIDEFSNPLDEFNELVGDSLAVKVLPDGRVALPLVEDMNVVGLTAEQLARSVEQKYRDILAEPVATVSVTSFSTPFDELSAVVGEGLSLKVLPDGRITLPLVGSENTVGLTARALAQRIEARYGAILEDPVISVNVTGFSTPFDELSEIVGDGLTPRVLPDGHITLPFVGPVRVIGQTLSELAELIEAEYAHILRDPEVAVSVTNFSTPLDDFGEAIGSGAEGRSRNVSIGPDGTINLPLLPPIQAQGAKVEELEDMIDTAYRAINLNVTVSVLPKEIRSDRILIFGEVGDPGPLSSDRPQTVLTAVASAGGVLTSGSMESIKVFYVDEDMQPRVRSVNLRNVLDKLRLEEDMIVPDNSVIYVPPTQLAVVGRFLDAVLGDILRYNGFGAGLSLSYLLNQDEGNQVVPVTTP